MKLLIFTSSLFFTLCPFLVAQEVAPAVQSAPRQQVSVMGSGAITRKVTDAGVTYKPDTVAGFSAAYRYNLRRWLGAEAGYSYLPETQRFVSAGGTTAIDADVHAVTASAVFQFSNPLAKSIKSFVTVGGGALLFEPRHDSLLKMQVRNTIQLGGGEDFPLSRRLLLRVQIASFTYKAPDFGLTSIHTNKYVQTVVPSVGLVYRF